MGSRIGRRSHPATRQQSKDSHRSMKYPTQVSGGARDTLHGVSASKSRRVSVVILGASFGTTNLGVRALAAGAIKSVLHQRPDAHIQLMDYSKDPAVFTVKVGGEDVRVPLVNIRFSKRIWLPNNIAFLIALALAVRCLPSKRVRDGILSGNTALRAMAEADMVVTIAGGDSFSDIYGMKRLIYVTLPQILAIILRKQLFVAPQTIGPFKSKVAKLLARFVVRRAAVIYSRDLTGVETVERQLVGKDSREKIPVRFCYDLGLVVDPATPREGKRIALQDREGRSLVGLNVSGLLLMGGYTKGNMFGLRTSYRDLVVKVIDHVVLDMEADVLLVPHVFGSDPKSESDVVACETVYEATKLRHGARVDVLRGEYDQNEIKSVIGSCDFFIGSRMHACIAAVSQGVPTVAIAYSDKFRGVMRSLGIEEIVVDARSTDADEIVQKINSVYQNRDGLHHALTVKMREVNETVLGLFSSLATSDTGRTLDRDERLVPLASIP